MLSFIIDKHDVLISIIKHSRLSLAFFNVIV